MSTRSYPQPKKTANRVRSTVQLRVQELKSEISQWAFDAADLRVPFTPDALPSAYTWPCPHGDRVLDRRDYTIYVNPRARLHSASPANVKRGRR